MRPLEPTHPKMLSPFSVRVGNSFSTLGAGRVAQRLAQLPYTQLVGGSNPSSPTKQSLQGPPPDGFRSFDRPTLPLRMRLHLRTHGFIDWPAIIGCLAVVGAIAFSSNIATDALQVARWKAALGVTTLVAAISAGSPPARSTFVRGILGCLSPLWRVRSAEVTVIDSEAERDRIHRGPEKNVRDVDLSPRARYVVVVELEEGSCLTCVLPLQDWARLRVGATARLVWQGIWLRSIHPIPSHEAVLGTGETC